jgi:hypothetical protein
MAPRSHAPGACQTFQREPIRQCLIAKIANWMSLSVWLRHLRFFTLRKEAEAKQVAVLIIISEMSVPIEPWRSLNLDLAHEIRE